MPLAVPLEEAGISFEKQFKFECIPAYEIVPSGEGTYTIHVPTEMILAPADRVCPPSTCLLKVPVTQLPDIGTASEQTRQPADAYCAKTHRTVVVSRVGFDMGHGLTFILKCVPPRPIASSRTQSHYSSPRPSCALGGSRDQDRAARRVPGRPGLAPYSPEHP